MAVDAMMRKLKIPSKFIPYLEKHRIYELFYDLGNELAMSQPEDPLIFIKKCLERLDQIRDKRLVIILASSHFDRIKLAQLISARTGYGMLSRYVICSKFEKNQDPLDLAVKTANHINSSDKDGWIFVDFPETKEEAKALIKQKVIPTHTFLLLHEKTNENEKDRNSQYVKLSPSDLTENENNTFELREIFKSSLKVIMIKNNQNLEDIASLCAQFTTKTASRRVQKLFRVALIGPKGSRRRTIAKLLQEKYNLVHVDIFHLINAARELDNELGDKIKYLEKWKIPYSNQLIFDLLKSRLTSKDCLERGYVLTNYPRSREDFVLLDSLETPPNKVIFFSIQSDDCKKRLEDRVVNMYTGEIHSRKSIYDNELLKNQFLTHPDDDVCVVEEDLKFYDKHVTDLVDYCGKTPYFIDATGSVKSLLEQVEQVLMSPAPTARARSGKIQKQKSSLSNYSSQITNIATSYPFSRTQVVPLIESEELIRRYINLKKSSAESRISEDFEKYSRSSTKSNENTQLRELMSEGIRSKDENSYCTCTEPLLDSENISFDLDDSLIVGDSYCTCDEPLLVDSNVFCICDYPLSLDEEFCTCEEPLIFN